MINPHLHYAFYCLYFSFLFDASTVLEKKSTPPAPAPPAPPPPVVLDDIWDYTYEYPLENEYSSDSRMDSVASAVQLWFYTFTDHSNVAMDIAVMKRQITQMASDLCSTCVLINIGCMM